MSDDDAYDPLAAETTYPLRQLLGFEITQWSDGHVRVEQPIHEGLFNRYGIPHGGVSAALIDVTAGYSGCWCPVPGRRRTAMTLSLNVSYIGRPTGSVLIAEGRKTGGGRKTYFSSVEVADDNGTLVASGQAVLRYLGNSGDINGDPADGESDRA